MAHTLVIREQLLLKSRKKWTVKELQNKACTRTFIEVTALAKKIGVTRLYDITDMDILRIPNYSAILPGLRITFGFIAAKVLQNPCKSKCINGKH